MGDIKQMMTAFALALPYLAILAYSWDRRQTPIGLVVCICLAIVELLVAGHLWVAFLV